MVVDHWLCTLFSPLRVSERKTTSDFRLAGPIAINWLKVVGDVYAVQNAVNNHILNMCPFVEEMGNYNFFLFKPQNLC